MKTNISAPNLAISTSRHSAFFLPSVPSLDISSHEGTACVQGMFAMRNKKYRLLSRPFTHLPRISISALLFALVCMFINPLSALACGGMFTPDTYDTEQSAERLIFTVNSGQVTPYEEFTILARPKISPGCYPSQLSPKSIQHRSASFKNWTGAPHLILLRPNSPVALAITQRVRQHLQPLAQSMSTAMEPLALIAMMSFEANVRCSERARISH